MDLAGSEPLDGNSIMGKAVSSHITKSLHFLSSYVALLRANDTRAGSNNCKLTKLLRQSLGGNAETVFICFIQPDMMRESKDTLAFTKSTSIIETHATNQPKLTPQMEIAQLKHQLEKNQQYSVRQLKEQEDRHKNELALKDRQWQEELAQRDTPTGVLPVVGNIVITN